MNRPPNDNKVEELAAGVAQGMSMRRAAEAAGLPHTTARRWALDPSFKAKVGDLRREIMSRAVGVLATASVEAAVAMLRVIRDPNTDAETLIKACRGVFADLRDMHEYIDLAGRLEALESDLAEQGKGESWRGGSRLG